MEVEESPASLKSILERLLDGGNRAEAVLIVLHVTVGRVKRELSQHMIG